MNKNLVWSQELVNKFWTGISGSRLDDLSFAKLNGDKLINLVSPWIKSGDRILDFGAGSGFLVQLLLKKGFSVAAFDPSDGRESALTSVVGTKDNFLGLEHGAGDEKYDVVIFSEVIEHILEADYQNVISRVVRYVADGGVLIITTPNQEDIEQKASFCPSCQHFFHPWQHVRSIHPASLVEQFSKLGLTKQFLSLVDFSNDAETIEFGEIARGLFEEFDRLEATGVSISNVLNDKASPRKKDKNILAQLFLSAKDSSYDAEEMQGGVQLAHLLQKMLVDVSNAKRRLSALTSANQSQQFVTKDGMVDLCVGNMSTMVYVGRKIKS